VAAQRDGVRRKRRAGPSKPDWRAYGLHGPPLLFGPPWSRCCRGLHPLGSGDLVSFYFGEKVEATIKRRDILSFITYPMVIALALGLVAEITLRKTVRPIQPKLRARCHPSYPAFFCSGGISARCRPIPDIIGAAVGGTSRRAGRCGR
jgi:hypothetical protein